MERLPSIGLRGRLAIAIAFILLGALTITYFAVYRGTGSELRQRTEADLEREVESLSGKMASGPELTPQGYSQRASQLAMAENFGTSSRVVSITVRGGTPQTNQPDLLGLTAGELLAKSRASVDFAKAIRARWQDRVPGILLNGVVGPAGDGYAPGRLPGVAETVDIDHIKAGYYSIKTLNPSGIVPVGPETVLRLIASLRG